MSFPPSDPDLLRFAATGDGDAFRAVVERYLPPVRATAARVLGARAHLADDVAQHVFIDLAKQAGRLPHNLVLSSWLHACAVKKALTFVRAEERRARREAAAVADEEMARDEDRRGISLDRVLLRLSSSDRDVISLRFFENCQLKEIAGRLGITPAVAQKRVERALVKLRVRLGKEGAAGAVASMALLVSTRSSQAACPGLIESIVTNGTSLSGRSAALNFFTPTAIIMASFKPVVVGAAAGLAICGAVWLADTSGSAGVMPVVQTALPPGVKERPTSDVAMISRPVGSGEVGQSGLDAELGRFSRILEIRDLNRRTEELGRFLKGFAPGDYPALVRYFRAVGGPDYLIRSGWGNQPDELLLVMSSWAKADSAAAAAYALSDLGSDQAGIAVMKTWAAADSGAALEWVKEFSKGSPRDAVLAAESFKAIIGEVAANDPAQAETLALGLTGKRARELAFGAIVQERAKLGEAGMRSWIEGLPDEASREAAASAAVGIFGASNPQSTLEWLNVSGLEATAGMSRFAQEWAAVDRGAAVSYLESLADGAARKAVLEGLAESSTRHAGDFDEMIRYVGDHPEDFSSSAADALAFGFPEGANVPDLLALIDDAPTANREVLREAIIERWRGFQPGEVDRYLALQGDK